MLDDDEYAEQLLNMPDAPNVPTERISEWSPDREGLARIEDAVKALTVAMIAINGQKPPAMKPAVRPITAADRMRYAVRTRQHASLVARILPPERDD